MFRFAVGGNLSKNEIIDIVNEYMELSSKAFDNIINKKWWIYKEHNDGWIMIEGFIRYE